MRARYIRTQARARAEGPGSGRRRFEGLTEPAGAPVTDLALMRHAAVAVPCSVR
jgi:hypothetical protein